MTFPPSPLPLLEKFFFPVLIPPLQKISASLSYSPSYFLKCTVFTFYLPNKQVFVYLPSYVPWDLECNELKVENIKNELTQLVPLADKIRIVMECENFPPRIKGLLQHQRPCTQFYYTTTHYGEDILAATPANGGRNEPAFYGPFPY